MQEATTSAPTRTLAQLKEIVTRNLNATIECGIALREIRDRDLWKDEADSFHHFCVDNWGVSRSRAYQLIDSAEIVAELSPAVSTAVDTERAARELKKAPAEAREEIIINAEKDKNGKVTGPSVAKAVKEHAEKAVPVSAPEAPKLFDRTGFEIPQPSPAISTWMRAEEVQSMLTALSRIKGVVEKACGNAKVADNDVIYAEVGYAGLVADLNSSYQQLKVALPFAVCPTCQGRVLSPCSTCSGRGMVSEFFWKHMVPEKTKEIREKAVHAMLTAGKKGKK